MNEVIAKMVDDIRSHREAMRDAGIPVDPWFRLPRDIDALTLDANLRLARLMLALAKELTA